MISILIPWRQPPGEEGEHRARVWKYLRPMWDGVAFEVVAADSPGERFSVAAATNEAARRATGSVFVTYGADQVPHREAISNAAMRVLDGQAWSPVFNAVGYLKQEVTERVLDGYTMLPEGDEPQWFAHIEPGAPGLYAVHCGVWFDVGGMDENFTGWGYEDLAMIAKLTTLHAPDPGWPDYLLRELWHPSAVRDRTEANPSHQRYHQHYVPALGDAVAMRALASS